MSKNDVRVLVVDDDESMRATLMDFISRLGVKVRTAGSVEDARRSIEQESPPFDIILADLKLPGGSGLDIVKSARAKSFDTLVSIVTGYASLETALEAIRLGAYDYITKPFSLDQIGIQVRNMIGRVTLSKENARLSLRLQELYEKVNKLQSEKSEVGRFQDEVRQQLAEIQRKLEHLGGSRPVLAARSESDKEKGVVSGLVHEIEKLDRMRDSSSLTNIELEQRKRSLIEEFVDRI